MNGRTKKKLANKDDDDDDDNDDIDIESCVSFEESKKVNET